MIKNFKRIYYTYNLNCREEVLCKLYLNKLRCKLVQEDIDNFSSLEEQNSEEYFLTKLATDRYLKDLEKTIKKVKTNVFFIKMCLKDLEA